MTTAPKHEIESTSTPSETIKKHVDAAILTIQERMNKEIRCTDCNRAIHDSRLCSPCNTNEFAVVANPCARDVSLKRGRCWNCTRPGHHHIDCDQPSRWDTHPCPCMGCTLGHNDKPTGNCISTSDINDNAGRAYPDDGLTHADLSNFVGTNDNIHVLGDVLPGQSHVLNTEEMVWCKLAIASDSDGARHVTAKTIFHTAANPAERSNAGHTYYGANNSPIDNDGGHRIESETNDGVQLTMDFDVADVSRPLLSVTEVISKQRHREVYDQPASYIRHNDRQRKHMRSEDNIFFLDVWFRVPTSVAANPFCATG